MLAGREPGMPVLKCPRMAKAESQAGMQGGRTAGRGHILRDYQTELPPTFC